MRTPAGGHDLHRVAERAPTPRVMLELAPLRVAVTRHDRDRQRPRLFAREPRVVRFQRTQKIVGVAAVLVDPPGAVEPALARQRAQECRGDGVGVSLHQRGWSRSPPARGAVPRRRRENPRARWPAASACAQPFFSAERLERAERAEQFPAQRFACDGTSSIRSAVSRASAAVMACASAETCFMVARATPCGVKMIRRNRHGRALGRDDIRAVGHGGLGISARQRSTRRSGASEESSSHAIGRAAPVIRGTRSIQHFR